MKKRLGCSSICDYLSKLSSNFDVTEQIGLNRSHCLTDNNKIENKPPNGRDSYYIIDEIPAQVEIPPNPSNELIPFQTKTLKRKRTFGRKTRKVKRKKKK